MTRWLVKMGPHRLVIPGDTVEDASDELDRRCKLLGLERETAGFKKIADDDPVYGTVST